MAAGKKNRERAKARTDALRQMVRSAGSHGDPWYTLPKKEMAVEVDAIVQDLKKEQEGRRIRYVRNLERFERRHMSGFGADAYFSSTEWEDSDRLGLIRSAVTSAVAEIYAPQKPKPQFQTLGASWEARRRAYRLDRICEGILNSRVGRWLNVWSFMLNDVATELALQGVAPVKVTANVREERIHHRLIPHPYIFFDPAEGREPRNLFQIEPIDANKILQQFPKFNPAWIDGAREWDWDRLSKTRTTRTRVVRQVELVWAYSLPDGPDDPGVWIATIGQHVAGMGQWDAPKFPFVFPMWEPHRDSPWASGIADEAGDHAEEVSDLDLRYAIRARLAAKKRVWYVTDSVQEEDLELNDAEVAIPYTGAAPPTETLLPPFTDLELNYRNRKIGDFWERLGLSQISAAARREQGISSGIAIMTLNDTKAGRQLPKAKRYEDSFPELGQQYVYRLREIAKSSDREKRALIIKLPGRRLMADMEWDKADIDDDRYSVTLGAASAVPHDPAGRQQWVATMFEAGLISPETAKTMIGNPDPDAAMDIDKAEEDYIDDLIAYYQNADEDDWDAGKYEGPEGMIRNKPRALEKFAAAWFRARIDSRGLPPEEMALADFNMKLLMRYIKEIDARMKRDQVFAAQLQGVQVPPGAAEQAQGQPAQPQQPPAQGATPGGGAP